MNLFLYILFQYITLLTGALLIVNTVLKIKKLNFLQRAFRFLLGAMLLYQVISRILNRQAIYDLIGPTHAKFIEMQWWILAGLILYASTRNDTNIK